MAKAAVRRPAIARASGAVAQVESVLTDRFQSAGLITAQVILPPDAICRRITTGRQRLKTLECAKINIVMRTLSNLHIRGKVDRRRGSSGMWEYKRPRSAITRKRGDIFKKIAEAVANGVDPYSIHNNRSTVSVYLCRLKQQKSTDDTPLHNSESCLEK
jgi:hypothetical protein